MAAPGGVVSNNVLWLRADLGLNSFTNGAVITQWADQSGNSLNGTPTNSPTVANGATNLNFNPAITLNGSNQYFTVPAGFANFTGGIIGFCGGPANSNE